MSAGWAACKGRIRNADEIDAEAEVDRVFIEGRTMGCSRSRPWPDLWSYETAPNGEIVQEATDA